jgi:sugar (pentulose or hexulose) kinase
MKYIALDLGSSFMKSAVLDLECRLLLDLSKEPTPPKIPTSNSRHYEVSAEAIADCVLRRIELHMEQHSDIQGIVLSTQMHGFVLTDSLGKAITPYISWQDHRCLGAVEGELMSGASTKTSTSEGSNRSAGSGEALSSFEQLSRLAAGLQATSGIRLTPRHAICNLYHYLRTDGQDICHMQGVFFQTLGSYITHRLTGEHATHLTNAAATGCVDIVNGQWNESLIAVADCGFLKFPEIRRETEVVGVYPSGRGPIAVYPDIGDHQATVLGCFATAQEDATITLGTAGIISCIDLDWSASGVSYEVRPYFEGQFLNTITQLPGGRNLDVLIHFVQSIASELLGMKVTEEHIWQGVYQLLEQVPAPETGSGLQLELGFYQEQRGVDKGMITGIDSDNLRAATLFAAAFDNLADVYRRMLHVLCGDNKRLQRIIFSGGLVSRNQALREKLTEKMGLPSSLSPYPEESLAGLFRLGLVCSGLCRNLEETERYLSDIGLSQ